MCGIAGIIAKNGALSAKELAALVKRMADTMVHRGPDDSGVWVSSDGRCAFAQRRLAIIDLSPGGHQPMLSADGKRVITFNGEIYNFLELREELEAKGAVFRSRSDTEVLLEYIGRDGVKALPRLDAMFAFGHYDERSGELLLARDLFGEKPLYYVETDRYFAFASELHALTLLPGFDASIDREAIAAYLAFQYVPQPGTIYRAARKLPPASYLRLSRDGVVEVAPYWQFRTAPEFKASRSLDDLADELEAILITSIKRRLISDVPLGAFLSGGVDSTTVVALAMKKLGVELNTFSIGFENHAASEHFEAAMAAKMLGARHHDQVLSADALALGEHIGKVLDEPNGDSSCLPTYLLSKFARERVTVAISGDGGDEMFGGYGRYFNTGDEWDRSRAGEQMPGWWSPGNAYISNRLLVHADEPLKLLFGEIPPGLMANLTASRVAMDSDPRPSINVMREIDAGAYMPGAVLAKVDRMSMQHSLEVRAPLIGLDVANFASGLAGDACYANGSGKLVLKQVAKRYLPAEWIDRPKRGFGLPETLWGAKDLMPRLRALALADDARLPAWIGRDRLTLAISNLEMNFHAYQAWALFILECWLRTHPAVPADGESNASKLSLGARLAEQGAQLLRAGVRALR